MGRLIALFYHIEFFSHIFTLLETKSHKNRNQTQIKKAHKYQSKIAKATETTDGEDFNLKTSGSQFRAGVSNKWPAGRIRPAQAFFVRDVIEGISKAISSVFHHCLR